MRFLSVCSGIEAASVAWGPLGFEAAAFAEIEPFPCAVLEHHYPETENLGDLTKIGEGDLERIQRAGDVAVLVGGTPCQSFSVAGLRKGLADPRGNLALRFLQLARALRPFWVVWENVPGVLSSGKGRDFGAFLGGLEECGYGWAYRVLDAQYFGLAQRRKRVFVVGCLGGWAPAAAVLLERASLSWSVEPRRSKGKGTVAGVAPSLRGSGPGCARTGDSRGQDPVVAEADGGVAPTLQRGHGNPRIEDPMVPEGPVVMSSGQANAEISRDQSPTLNYLHEAPMVFGDASPLAPTLGASGAGVERTGNERTEADFLVTEPGYIAPRQIRNSKTSNQVGIKPDAKVADALSTDGPGAVLEPLPFDPAQITSPDNYSNPKPGDPNHPLAAGSAAASSVVVPEVCDPITSHPYADRGAADESKLVPEVADPISASEGKTYSHEGCTFRLHNYVPEAHVAFSQNQREEIRDLGDLAAAVKSPGTHESTLVAGPTMSLKTDVTPKVGGDLAHTMTQPSPSGGGQPMAVLSAMRVRRLTPRECERLQGFPDDYTLFPMTKATRRAVEADFAAYLRRQSPDLTDEELRRCSKDGPRYRALGNSMAVPVMAWIGKRILAVQKALHERGR